jgi:sugar phosphate isomerase/epimerase
MNQVHQSDMAPRRDRRGFLAAAVGAIAVAAVPARQEAAGAEPPQRRGPPRLKPALAAYGFRQFFPWSRGKPQAVADPAKTLSIAGFIDLCADHGCDAELTAYYFDPAVTDADLAALRRHAHLRGITISGTAVGNRFTRPSGPELDGEVATVKQWIDRTALLGAGHMRVFAGPAGDGLDEAAARRQCVMALEECCAHAATRGVMLGLENHGGIVDGPDGLLAVVEAVRSDWLGISLDTGNFHSPDPYADLARCAPHAVNVQYKVAVRRTEAGPAQPAGPLLPAEPTDPDRIVALLRAAGYQGSVALEYEEAEDPFTAVPRHLAALQAAMQRAAG